MASSTTAPGLGPSLAGLDDDNDDDATDEDAFPLLDLLLTGGVFHKVLERLGPMGRTMLAQVGRHRQYTQHPR
jgi:hypothetical protein